jgi:hypothetical protein
METLRYMTLTAHDPHLIKLVETYAKEQGMYRTDASPDPMFTDSPRIGSCQRGAKASPARAGRRTASR